MRCYCLVQIFLHSRTDTLFGEYVFRRLNIFFIGDCWNWYLAHDRRVGLHTFQQTLLLQLALMVFG